MADLRDYFEKIKKLEEIIAEPYTVVVSIPTSDGGKAGVKTEVSRHQAARLVAEGKARLANEDEMAEFQAEIRHRIEQQERQVRNDSMRLALLTSAILKDHGMIEGED